MFNLESAIKDWRRKMLAGGIPPGDALDELESHLRDDIEQRTQSGLDEQKAFEAAITQIGPAGTLKSEFAKSSGASGIEQKLYPYACIVAVAYFPTQWCLQSLSAPEVIPAERALGYVSVALINICILTALLLPQIRNPRARLKAQIAAALVCMVGPVLFVQNVVPYLQLNTSHIIMVALWVSLAFGVLNAKRGRDKATGFDFPQLEQFDDNARQSLEFGRAEAIGFHHDYIGTEHVLLGVLQAQSGVVGDILQKHGVTTDAIRAEIGKIALGATAAEPTALIPYTPRAKRAFKLAAREAKSSKQPRIRPEHVFLGLLAEGNGIAAIVLGNLGLRIERVRQEIAN